MTLHEFLALPHRFRWGGVGGDDCTTFCATWISEQIGIDPAAHLRGTYRTEEGAHALLDAAGGLVPFMASHLEPIGFIRTDAPADGDVGVIDAPVGLSGETKEIGAIRFGPLWLALGPDGAKGKKLDFVAAWRFAG
ncbi:DUF6950 family protein [Rhizobium leucaenae]|uniref:DUF6950 family protein n=1 Tax=Rhizobium leucaenae TaxID=29450 RepID=UPI001609A217|nr:hypothetical protein [Rhizobium leucaenae]MBB6299898.1 hypothetical protein [Rhizobium leucaenae]